MRVKGPAQQVFDFLPAPSMLHLSTLRDTKHTQVKIEPLIGDKTVRSLKQNFKTQAKSFYYICE